MKVEIRKSIAGTEYWDTEKKKTIFVPKGQQPDFEITDNYGSMVGEKSLHVDGLPITIGNVVVDTDGIKGERLLTNQASEIIDSDGNTKEDLDGEPVEEIQQNSLKEESSELDSMTIKQLREYAKENNIIIPSALKTKGDIIALISDYE